MSENTFRRKQILVLITSYLYDLSEEELFKVLEILRRSDTFRHQETVQTVAELPLNKPLAHIDCLVPGNPDYETLMCQFRPLPILADLLNLIERLKLSTAHYGVLILPRCVEKSTGTYGVDVMFGIRNVVDIRVTLNWSDKMVHTVDQTIGSKNLTFDSKKFFIDYTSTTEGVFVDLLALHRKYNRRS